MYWGKNGYFFDHVKIRPITPETYSHYQTLIKNYSDEVLKLQSNPISLYYPGLDGLGDFFNATPLEQFLAKEAFGPFNKYSTKLPFTLNIKQYRCIHAWVTMKALLKYVKPAFFSTDYCTDMIMNICSALSEYYVSYDLDRPHSDVPGLPDDFVEDPNLLANDVDVYLIDEILIPIVDKAVREYSKVFDIFNTIETYGLSLDHFTTRYSERYFNLNNGRRHSSISSFTVTTSEDERLKDYFSLYCLIKEYDFDDSCLKYFNKGGTYQTTHARLTFLGITPAMVVKKFTDALQAKVKGNRFLSEILNPKHLSNFLDDVSIVSKILIRYKRTFASIGRTHRPMSIFYNDLLLTPAEESSPYRSNIDRIDIHFGFERGFDLTPLSEHASLRDIFINIRKSFADIFMTPLKSGHKGNYQSLLEEGESIYVAIIYFWLYKYKNWFDGTTKVSTCGLTLNVHNHTVIKKYGDKLFERFEMSDEEAFSFLPENSNVHPKDFFKHLVETVATETIEALEDDFEGDLSLPTLIPQLEVLKTKGWKHISNIYDLVSEGEEMNHCVGGYDYIERAKEGDLFFHYDDSSKRGLTIRMEVRYSDESNSDIYGGSDTHDENAGCFKFFAKAWSGSDQDNEYFLFNPDPVENYSFYRIDQVRGHSNEYPSKETMNKIRKDLRDICCLDYVRKKLKKEGKL